MRHHLRIFGAAAALLTIVLAGPSTAQAQNRDKWGINDDSGFTTDIAPVAGHWHSPAWGAGAYAKAYEAGFGWSRYGFFWNNLNPSLGTYDFTSSDFEVNAILSKGVQVYAGIMLAPNFAVQNTDGYVTWKFRFYDLHAWEFRL